MHCTLPSGQSSAYPRADFYVFKRKGWPDKRFTLSGQNESLKLHTQVAMVGLRHVSSAQSVLQAHEWHLIYMPWIHVGPLY